MGDCLETMNRTLKTIWEEDLKDVKNPHTLPHTRLAHFIPPRSLDSLLSELRDQLILGSEFLNTLDKAASASAIKDHVYKIALHVDKEVNVINLKRRLVILPRFRALDS